MDSQKRGFTRREVGQLALAVAATAAGGSLFARRAHAQDDKLVTEIEAMATLVTALNYTNESTTEGQHCSNCLFYTGPADGQGKCQLFTQGQVKGNGWCSSWSAKS